MRSDKRLPGWIVIAFFLLLNSGLFAQTTKTVGATGADYATLKDAFDAINAGTITGSLTLRVIASTTETATAVLNASGSGSANYTSVSIYPTLPGLSISGNLAMPMIDFNGADNVTIDGRVNATGSAKDLTIINSSTSGVAATSTIRFINDASSNTIKYSTIRGSHTNLNSGVILFSTTTGTTGNDNNIIDNNNITGSSQTDRPSEVIYSAGTASKLNSENTVSNNYIYDFMNSGTWVYGIWLQNNNSAWTITGNSLYETATLIPTSSGSHNFITVSGSSGENFNVSNNYIGGSAPVCGGTPLTKTNAFNNNFYGISVSSGYGIANNIQGNTIRNIDYKGSSTQSFWYGISVSGGNSNVGTVTGNVIGEPTGNGSIVFSANNNASGIYGINVSGAGIKLIENNSIGSITLSNANPVLGTSFAGIRCSANGTTVVIKNNLIGSIDPLTNNSIYQTSLATGNGPDVIGIYSTATADNVTISNNIVSKLTNASSGSSGVCGITVSIGVLEKVYTVSDNTIMDLKDLGTSTSLDYRMSVIGISFEHSNLSSHFITGNTIYNLSNTNPAFAGGIAGIYYYGTTLPVTVTGNFMHSMSITGVSSTGGQLFGIKHENGLGTYANNIISLGGNSSTTVNGIYDTGLSGMNINLYFNTVYISGSPVSGTNPSYCLYSGANANIRDFRNNIFFNARSNNGAGGKHYAAYFNYATITGLVLGYNNYYTPGTGGVPGFYNSADVNSLPLVPALDGNSLNINPGLANAGGTAAVDYEPSAVMNGITSTGISADYFDVSRPGVPTMGAIENSLPTAIELNLSATEDFVLHQNQPNPFNSTTRISWNLPAAGFISLKVYNIYGNEVATLVNEEMPAGSFEMEYNGSALTTGTYFFRLQSGHIVLTKKMMKIR